MLDEQEKFFKNGETWVSLRMEDILAEDWEIVKDSDIMETKEGG